MKLELSSEPIRRGRTSSKIMEPGEDYLTKPYSRRGKNMRLLPKKENQPEFEDQETKLRKIIAEAEKRIEENEKEKALLEAKLEEVEETAAEFNETENKSSIEPQKPAEEITNSDRIALKKRKERIQILKKLIAEMKVPAPSMTAELAFLTDKVERTENAYPEANVAAIPAVKNSIFETIPKTRPIQKSEFRDASELYSNKTESEELKELRRQLHTLNVSIDTLGAYRTGPKTLWREIKEKFKMGQLGREIKKRDIIEKQIKELEAKNKK